MSAGDDILFALEKTVHQVVSSAQAACRTAPNGDQIKGWLYEVTAHLQRAVDAQRGAQDPAPALELLDDALGRLRTLLPRGTEASERVALARWLCDAARAGAAPSPVG